MDYQSNSHKDKKPATKPEKKVQRVTKGEVIVAKKSPGRKFKEIFVMADFRSVMEYVVTDVLLPAARNMIVDSASKGVERLMYGASNYRRPGGSKVTYGGFVNREPRDVISRSAPRGATGGLIRPHSQRQVREDFILTSRDEAETVLERMQDIIETYDIVTVADFNELVGFPSNHVDNKWGWDFIGDVQIRQIREGYLIDLPPAQPVG